MPEAPIKRTNFFDGQFLMQGEFLDLEAYHRHMRRRMLYMLFDKSGVVQRTPVDLTLEVANAAAKQIRVKAGTALGRIDDIMEAKEIVLRADAIVDLNAQTPPIAATDTAVLTIHYAEQETDPSSLGGVTGNMRIAEQAVLTAHPNTLPGPTAPNGEPYVRLGNVVYSSLAISAPRDTAYLQIGLMAPTATIAVTPNTLTAGTTVTVVIVPTGFDISYLTAGDIAPMAGITVSSVGPVSASSATVTLNVQTLAVPGPRTLTVSKAAVPIASANVTVNAGLQVSGFSGVDTSLAIPDTMFKINGTGFVAGAQVEFSTGVGTWTPLISVLAANISPTQLRIPLTDIPNNAIVGPVRVTSGGSTVTSASNVTPPPVIVTCPTSATSQTLITITGFRFVTGVVVGLPGGAVRGPGSVPPFPDAGNGELRSDTSLTVKVVSAGGTAGRVRITTAGGTVQSTANLSVN